MRKAHFFTFLLLVFFIPAFANAGNTACDKRQDKYASALTNAYACTMADEGNLPVLLAIPDCCVPIASRPHKGLQDITGYNEIYFSRLNFNLSGPVPPIVSGTFLQRNKYLFYIYPFHNFW